MESQFLDRLFEGEKKHHFPYLLILGHNFSKDDLLYLYESNVKLSDYIHKVKEKEYIGHDVLHTKDLPNEV